MRARWHLFVYVVPLFVVVHLVVQHVLVEKFYPGGLSSSPLPESPFPPEYPVPPREKWVTIEPEGLRGDPGLEHRLRLCSAAADQVAGPDWDVQPFHLKQRHHSVWSAWWRNRDESLTDMGELPPTRRAGEHVIRIHARRGNPEPWLVTRLSVSAQEIPARDSDWCASVTYHFDSYGTEFSFALQRTDGASVRLNEELKEFNGQVIYKNATYSASATLPSEDKRSVEQAILGWYASPDSFREQALQRLARLDKVIDASESMKPVRGYRSAASKPSREVTLVSYWGEPPDEIYEQLPDAYYENWRQEAHAQVAKTRALIETYHREMHAALVRVFPLHEVLVPSSQRP